MFTLPHRQATPRILTVPCLVCVVPVLKRYRTVNFVFETQSTVHTEWQLPTFGRIFHHDGKIGPGWWGWGGGGALHPPFTLSTITSKVVVVRSSSEGRYTPPISTLPLYVQYSQFFPLCTVNHINCPYTARVWYCFVPYRYIRYEPSTFHTIATPVGTVFIHLWFTRPRA